MFKKSVLSVLVVALLGFSAATVQAGPLVVDFQNVLLGAGVTRTIVNASSVVSATAGLYHFIVDGADVYTFCIEPLEFTDTNPLVYNTAPLATAPTNLVPPMGDAKADLIMELLGRFAPIGFYSVGPAAYTALQAQALQIAIWEIVRETSGTLDVTAGNIYFGAGANVTKAQDYLSALNGAGPKLSVDAAVRIGNQDFIHVPDPGSSLLLMGMGLAGLAAGARRWFR